MKQTSYITLDLRRPSYVTVYAAQDNKLTRFINVTLLDGSTPWTVPNNTYVEIAYLKPDGTGGLYDTDENNAIAYTISGNTVEFVLAQQALTVAGEVKISVHFINASNELLSSFAFRLVVDETTFPESELESENYFSVMQGTLASMAQAANEAAAFVGAPRVAATSADMTDHALIYVYTGTTGGGFTNGHWYYWNGSAWADGGTYNSQAFNTDKTLSVSGSAADAKRTGDYVFAALRNAFSSSYVPSNLALDANGKIYLEKGYISSTTGASTSSSSGKYYKTQVGNNGTPIFILIGSNPILAICDLDWVQWNCWSYSGTTNASATHSNTYNAYISGETPIYIPKNSTDKRIAFSFRKLGANDSERTAFTDEELATLKDSIKFYVVTDTSLTQVGKPADAKTVGDVIYNDNFVGKDFLALYGTFEDSETNGITFDWTGRTCHVTGTASATATYTVYNNRTSLPTGMRPNDVFFLDFKPSVESVNFRTYVAFWKEGDTSTPITAYLNYITRGIKVPSNAVGFTVQIRIATGAVANWYVNKISLIKLYPMKMDTPLMVSFVDDDTSGLSYVTKYHDACRHNGVFGNFAVITKFPEENETLKSTLLGYEDEGFGTVIHLYNQSATDNWQSMGNDPEKIAHCRAILAKGLRQMREFGFVNYNYWISPYGVKGSGPRQIAKDLGVKCLISTNNLRHNSMQDYDRYFIKRVALRQDDNGASDLHNTMADVKAEIDAAVASGACWLIITTHFNEWGGLTWDTTLDANGYPVGYSRFNEMVQYALNAGLTPVTIPEAWAEYETVLEANKEIVDRANA